MASPSTALPIGNFDSEDEEEETGRPPMRKRRATRGARLRVKRPRKKSTVQLGVIEIDKASELDDILYAVVDLHKQGADIAEEVRSFLASLESLPEWFITRYLNDDLLVFFPNLLELNLGHNMHGVTGKGLRRVKNLKQLTLSSYQSRTVSDEDLTELMSLNTLILEDCDYITGYTLPTLTILESLIIKGDSPIGDVVLLKMPNLIQLDVSGAPHVTDAALLNKPNLAVLRPHAQMSGTTLAQLPRLAELYLDHALSITDDKISRLVQLEKLVLWSEESTNDTISDAGIQDLVNLLELTLGASKKITGTGLRNLVNLAELDLTRNATIRDKDLIPHRLLTRLVLRENTKITHTALARLSYLQVLDLTSNRKLTKGPRVLVAYSSLRRIVFEERADSAVQIDFNVLDLLLFYNPQQISLELTRGDMLKILKNSNTVKIDGATASAEKLPDWFKKFLDELTALPDAAERFGSGYDQMLTSTTRKKQVERIVPVYSHEYNIKLRDEVRRETVLETIVTFTEREETLVDIVKKLIPRRNDADVQTLLRRYFSFYYEKYPF